MASCVVDNENKSEEQEQKKKERWKLARDGIDLMINNKNKEAERLFLDNLDNLQMYSGYSVVVFMDALMCFEDDKLSLALNILKEAEKRCSCERSWLKSVKLRMFGNEMEESLADYLESQIILADSLIFIATLTFLQQDLSGYFKGGWILRRSWKIYQSVYSEISNLYKQHVTDVKLPESNKSEVNREMKSSNDEFVDDYVGECDTPETPIPAPISNGYLLHNKSFPPSNQIKNPHQSLSCSENLSKLAQNVALLDSIDKSNPFAQCSAPPSRKSSLGSVLPSSGGFKSILKKSSSVNNALCKQSGRAKRVATKYGAGFPYFTSTFNLFSSVDKLSQDVDKETVKRLMSAVCFGYGLFQLGISLLPPALIKISNILGFSGNRQVGIDNLMFARNGTDMRAPLATLALLWYHTIIRPFYALDGSNVEAGVEAASTLIEESLQNYGDSALFLFFRGRVNRLMADIPSAVECFQKSIDFTPQRELKVLTKHELGWCYLINLDYANAESIFQYMKTCSRWSRSFYAYLATISAGAYGNFKDLTNIKEMRSILEGAPKGTQLEEFLLRRFRICPMDESVLVNTSSVFWRLLVYELLYLWNTLPSCNKQAIQKIIHDCEFTKENEVMPGLEKLLSGVCYLILKLKDRGISNLRSCLESRKSIANNAPDAHISAFAQYELGLMLIRDEGTKEEGKFLLQHINQYKDYDFEQRLSISLHNLKDK